MQFDMCCQQCDCQFVHELAASVQDVKGFEEEVFGYTLGDGGTVEDSLYTALSGAGQIRCPTCAVEVPLSEDDLGRLAMTMLGSW